MGFSHGSGLWGQGAHGARPPCPSIRPAWALPAAHRYPALLTFPCSPERDRLASALCGHSRSRAAVAYRARTRTSHLVVTGRRGLGLMERCFTNCANKTALQRRASRLSILLVSPQGERAGEELHAGRLPAESATGFSVPWASFSLTIKGDKVPDRRSEPAHVCSVGFCMVMEGKSKFYVYGCSARMCACVPHAFWCPRRPRKGVFDALELELEPVKSL